MQIFRSRGLITCNEKRETFEDAFLAVEKGKIIDRGPWKKRPRRFSSRSTKLTAGSRSAIDYSFGVILPGLFNLHSHLTMTLFRGIAEDQTLENWLQNTIFPLEKKWVSPAFVETGTDLGLLESLRFGTTFVVDMYFYAETMMKSFRRAGLRGWVAQNIWDLPGPDYANASAALEAFLKFDKAHRQKTKSESPRARYAIAPHSPYLCNKATLQMLAAAARSHSLPLTIHMAETQWEDETVRAKEHMSPLALIESAGLLHENRALLAHSVHVDESEMHWLQRENISVVLNPQCNAKLSSGFPPVKAYREKGIRFTIGTDGPASNNALDIFSEINFLSKTHHLKTGDLTGLPSIELLEAATIRAAEAVGESHHLGSLEPGKSADFIVVDFRAPHLCPFTSMINHIVHAVRGGDVDSVYIEGQALMRGRKIVAMDERRIRLRAERMWKKMKASPKP